VVMDNASFHKSQRTKELIESVGCKLIFLPPYSPDLSPIEKFWANMKRWIKNRICSFDKLYNALEIFFNTQTST
jgi:transposase